jgi:hypothetical protein
MEATRNHDPWPGLTELETVCVWTAARLHDLTWAALLGRGYDPDVYDLALLTHRAARACAAAARRAQAGPPAPAAGRPDQPPATGAARGGPSGRRGPG